MTSSPLVKPVSVARRLQEAFAAQEAVFADTKELLENQIPSGVRPKSREHANFLFFLISQDHGTKSSHLYDRAKVLYRRAPDHFDPVFISRRYGSEDAPGLLEHLSQLGVRYPRNARKGWYRNSCRLTGEFAGDARHVVRRHRSAADTIRLIRSFHGFGPKIGGLLFRVFVGVGMGHPERLDDVEFPVDIHDTRIAGWAGIADVPHDLTEDTYSPFVRRAQAGWRSACRAGGLDWLQVDRALWILGSKGCSTGRHYDCPIREFCVKGERRI